MESNMSRRIQAVTDSKEWHTKYQNVAALTLLGVIKYLVVLYYAYGE